MSKIHNVGLNLEHKIANPFKTSRNISTPNPFKNSNFEGNCIPFFAADVFEGSEIKKASKLRMITSSVAGSMTKLRSSITEPIVNFAKRVIGGVSSAWDYAKNTNISDIKGIKEFSEAWNNTMNMNILDVGKNISSSISGLGSHLGKMSFSHAKDVAKSESSLNNEIEHKSILNRDIIDIGKDLSAKWNSLVSSLNLNQNKISKDTPVSDLKLMWEQELSIASEREVA